MNNLGNNNSIVTHVRVVAHLSQDFGEGQSENHWSIYLLLEGGGASIRMNMAAAEYGDPAGTLAWTQFQYQLTNSALQHFDYPLAAETRVRDIYGLLYHLGRDRYEFSGGGSGCRYWWYVLCSRNDPFSILTSVSYTIMQDLEAYRYLGEGSSAHLWPSLQYLYSRSQAPRVMNWVEGQFY